MIDNLAGQVYHLELYGRTFSYTLRPGEDYTFEFLFQSRDPMVFTSAQEGRDFVEAVTGEFSENLMNMGVLLPYAVALKEKIEKGEL